VNPRTDTVSPSRMRGAMQSPETVSRALPLPAANDLARRATAASAGHVPEPDLGEGAGTTNVTSGDGRTGPGSRVEAGGAIPTARG